MLLKCKKDNMSKEEKMKIGVYDFNTIKCLLGEWCVIVGCHSIFEREIEKFIEYNNLKEWRNI